MKKLYFLLIILICIFIFISCQSNEKRATESAAATDTIQTPEAPAGIKEAETEYEFEAPAAEAAAPEETAGETSSEPEYYESASGSDIEELEPAAEPDPVILQPEKPQKTDGSLVYYCPTRMLEKTDNNVSVTITRAELNDAITLIEKRVEATTGKPAELIKKDVNGTIISISAKMKVELKYSEKDFETIYQPENVDQIFDGTSDMNWDWIIKPMKVGTKQLSIIVSAFDALNGRWIAVQSPPKIFDIKVQVDPRSYFVRMWEFLQSNPEWLFTQIFFPVIAFFFGKRQGKKSVATE